ncbi:hypothetical protein B0H13DRAFT_1903655 [Mycena leptocephala]|nr:hypothetical protein B0H13DRAFT_1903655 [Mycena leptocephala]
MAARLEWCCAKGATASWVRMALRPKKELAAAAREQGTPRTIQPPGMIWLGFSLGESFSGSNGGAAAFWVVVATMAGLLNCGVDATERTGRKAKNAKKLSLKPEALRKTRVLEVRRGVKTTPAQHLSCCASAFGSLRPPDLYKKPRILSLVSRSQILQDPESYK